MKKRICALLAVLMVVSLMTGMLGTPAQAALAPAPIQQTYVVDGVTYLDAGSKNFATDSMKFYKDLLSTRTSLLAYEYKAHYNSADDAPEVATYDQCIGDLWLRLGACMLEHLPPAGYYYGDMWTLDEAAVRGAGYTEDGSYYYSGKRYDMVQQPTLKDAENWALQKAFGTTKNFGYFKENTEEQPVLVTALGEYENAYGHRKALAAYFTNFKVYAMMPADEGSNYVTELVSDDINSEFTTASTVKNLTASTVTGSQTVSNSTTATVSSQTSGSELYSYNEGIKVGGEYKFTDAFKANVEVSFTASQAFGKGWGHGQSVSDSKSVSYTMSVPLAPYTQAMLTQRDKTSVFLTTYNCPIALRYDVTLVLYNDDGIMHISYKSPSISRDTVFQFADVTSGARGDLNKRNAACETAGDWDREYLYWRALDDLGYHHLSGTDARDTLITHVPISATGASFLQTLNVVSSEVSGLMPTHPLYRVKLAEPGVGPVGPTMTYDNFDYLSMNMEVGDSSYANYMHLVGVNQFDEPFYGFSKDNGYWIVLDKQGNPIDGNNSPIRLEKDPVSTNWRYTAVRPGTCFLVYQINEDVYFIADKPDEPIRNRDLKKTAALEVIVTEADPTDTIVITGSFRGHPNTDPVPLEAEGRLTAAVYDETGKEIEKPYTWEARELHGITVTPDGQVSFTKEGTYHVRAVNGNLRSDWYEITAGHTPGDMVRENDSAPTCTAAGSCDLVTRCSVCGAELEREHVEEPALGHNFFGGVVTREPTTTSEGEKTYTCTRCGEKLTESIDKLPPQELWPDDPGGSETLPDDPSVPAPQPETFENPFTDVKADDYFLEPVLWAFTHNPQITNGTDAATFSPGAACTRAQAVTFLWRARGCPEPKSTTNPFSDVPKDAYYYKAVLWANENNITNGTSATTFSPKSPCTRAHVVTFLWRAEGKPTVSSANPFLDVPAGRYYTDAVLWAVSKEITNGVTPTSFGPDSPCTRGQIVTFLYRDMK